MDIEQKQAEFIDQFARQAGTLEGASLAGLVVEATSHPSLFAFSEILSVPNLSKVRENPSFSSNLMFESKPYAALLRAFVFW